MKGLRVGFPLLLVAGVLLVQVAWIVAVPPFRGIDEVDHVYRAAAVAEGEWLPTTPAGDGRGTEVTVPESIVAAASAQCRALPYNGPDNCRPIREASNGTAVVASAAGTYNPVYYLALAPVVWVLDGAAVLYGMRAVTALLMLLGIWASAWCLVRGGARTWMRVGLVVAMTPVFLYTTVLPAPNGLEMVAGLGVWSALLALLRPDPGEPPSGGAMVVLAVCGSALALTRMLGPMWLALILACAVGVFGWARLVRVLRARPVASGVVTACVVVAGAGNAWWTVRTGMLGGSPDVDPAELADGVELGMYPVLWLLQVVAAFPTRTEQAHPLVYTICAVVFLALLVAGWVAARGRERAVLLGMLAVVALLPVGLTLATASDHDVIWQGRYGLAFAVGLPLLLGSFVDRRWPSPVVRGLGVVTVGVVAVAHAWSVVGVRLVEAGMPASTADPAWLEPSPYLLAALVGVAFVIMGAGVAVDHPTIQTTRQETDEPDRDDSRGDGGVRAGGPRPPAGRAAEHHRADATSG